MVLLLLYIIILYFIASIKSVVCTEMEVLQEYRKKKNFQIIKQMWSEKERIRVGERKLIREPKKH